MDVDRPRGGARKQKARRWLPAAWDGRGTAPRSAPVPWEQRNSCRRGSPLRRRAAAHWRLCRRLACLQGRGFREPMELEDRLQGGQFEALPADKGGSGPGPAKCEQHRRRHWGTVSRRWRSTAAWR